VADIYYATGKLHIFMEKIIASVCFGASFEFLER